MESISISNTIESCRLAPVIHSAKGRPRRSTMMCRVLPSLPRSVGLGSVSWPPGAGDTRPVDAGTAPFNLVAVSKLREEGQMELIPETLLLPITQPSPAGHAPAEAQFLG